MESRGKILDELAEVNALVGDVIEDSLVAVALELHVADFHLQSQSLGYLAALYHSVVFACLCLTVFVHVDRLCLTVDALDVVGILDVSLAELQEHETAGEGNDADVMTGVCLYRHVVALLKRQVVDVMIIALAGVLELNLHEVGALGVPRHVGKPVVGVQLTVLTSACSMA